MMNLADLPHIDCVKNAPIHALVASKPATLEYCKRYRFTYRSGAVFEMEVRKSRVVVKQRRRAR